MAEERLGQVSPALPHYHIGFIGIHEGKTGNFVFIDWWSDENELHHHIYASPPDRPTEFEYVTPTGLTACVWDLRVMSYERDAWVKTVLKTQKARILKIIFNVG